MVSIPKQAAKDKAYVNSPPLSPGFDRVFQQPFSSSDDEEEYANLSASSSNDDLNTVEVVFNKIYLDPLQEVMEEIDAEAAGILRTGKLTVHGEAGDMNILQPLLFSLQASDSELSVIHPQLLQNPFFTQKDENFTTANADTLLHNGCIRLGVMVDQVIYKLLSTHCCKGPGSRQADMLIETALKTWYTLPSPFLRFEANAKNSPPLVLSGYIAANTNVLQAIPDVTSSDEDEAITSPGFLDVPHTSAKVSRSSGIESSSSSVRQSFAEEDIPRPPSSQDCRPRAESLRHFNRRKDSIFSPPPSTPSSYFDPERRPSDGSDVSSTTSLRLLSESTMWHASLSYSGDMIVGSYGSESTYPILFWNTDLKVIFKLGTGLSMSSNTLIVDNPKDILKLKVVNTTDCKIGFAIRSYRQSMMFRSHVIFPKGGLHLLDPQQEWTIEAEFMSKEQELDEYICIDLLVCQLNSNPSWNVLRRYAVLKQSHDQHKLIKKLSRNEAVILPGAFATNKDLSHSVRQVILHGLQCVVKNKLDQAEVIFSQALHLPLFQRAPLKAFAYICLAVTANKRRKKGENTNKVSTVLKLVNSMDKLVEACESSPNMRMPKMIGLIKQLKKELNPAKVIRDQRQNLPKRQVSYRNETTKEVHSKGDALDLANISLLVPGGAVLQPVTITLSQLNYEDLHQSIQSSPWSSMLNVLAAISIQCSPPLERFHKPVIATVILPHETVLPSSPQLRLLQSNYMSTWVDITDDPCTEVSVDAHGRLTLRTDQTGWIVVASLQLDINKIMPLAIKSVFTEEPVVMDVNAYGCVFQDMTHAQISVFITPHQETPPSSISSRSETPPGHRQISFPHTFKAYKNQKIRIELQGQFEPDVENGHSSLQSDVKIDGVMEVIYAKMIKIPKDSRGLYGKLTLSTFCKVHNEWEKIHEINLSSPNTSN